MATAMVASLVPATAFAAPVSGATATAKVVNAETLNEDDPDFKITKPELQITITDTDYPVSAGGDTTIVVDTIEEELTISLDGAEFDALTGNNVGGSGLDLDDLKDLIATGDATAKAQLDAIGADLVKVYNDDHAVITGATVTVDPIDTEVDELDIIIELTNATAADTLYKDDYIVVDLESTFEKNSAGAKATVSVDGDMISTDDMIYAQIQDQGFVAGIKKPEILAEEEIVTLSNPIKVKEAVKGSFVEDTAAAGDPSNATRFKLKLSKGFEFVNSGSNQIDLVGADGLALAVDSYDDDEIIFSVTTEVTSDTEILDEFVIENIEIEATSAKSGDIATIKVYADNMDTVAVEVAEVSEYTVVMSVDEDEDLPVYYNGVNVDNHGLTVDDDHLSLEVTIEETFPGAWSMRDGFDFVLPEGVFVTDVDVTDIENFSIDGNDVPANTDSATTAAFKTAMMNAYEDGEYANFEFKKRVFDDVDHSLEEDPASVTFELELVAEPDFVGDVTLAFEGPLVDTQEVTIASFISPYEVTAEQNDVIIDYRFTEIPTDIVITEAEAGLWEEDAAFGFVVERGDIIQFEDDATYTVNEESEMEIDEEIPQVIDDITVDGAGNIVVTTEDMEGALGFIVEGESYDEVAVVTVNEVELFMQRSIPAGNYELELMSTLLNGFESQTLFQDPANFTSADPDDVIIVDHDDVDTDYSMVIEEAFVNVVTAGSDKDNTFTTTIVVPVGEPYLVAGGKQIELDTPAYISAEGYTMLPVRAVANALGVDTNSVLWNGDARTVTIMYGQRIITMTVGEKVITVNGSEIPASAAPEITDGRTFLPLRDLGNALGVMDINWDAATKTATLN